MGRLSCIIEPAIAPDLFATHKVPRNPSANEFTANKDTSTATNKEVTRLSRICYGVKESNEILAAQTDVRTELQTTP